MSELKSCPFCGEASRSMQSRYVPYVWIVHCSRLGCQAVVKGMDQEDAERIWNNRHNSELIDTQAALKECGEALMGAEFGMTLTNSKTLKAHIDLVNKALSNPLVIAAMKGK